MAEWENESVTLRVVRLGSERGRDEGLRIGTVRRPPRGVPKAEFASRDFYDAWLPELSPSPELIHQGMAAETDRDWQRFVRGYIKEMATPQARHLIALLAALSQETNLAVGCYCRDEARCHRTILRDLLEDAGADLG